MKPEQLMALADRKKCVMWLSGRNVPAAFVIGMPFRFIMLHLRNLKPYKRKLVK